MTNALETCHSAMTLLVVDDSPDTLRITGEILQPHFRVLAATSGEKALAMARSAPHPDLILLDIMMPAMDGFEVLRRLRAMPETAGIPVIFVTALKGTGDEARGLELGAVDYVTKPIIPELLLARVRTQLELKDARDWLQDRNTVLAAEVARQVIELQQAKDQAEAASRAKSTFINMMSHELRTPMNGIIGMLQLIKSEAAPDGPISHYANIALQSSLDMTHLLSAILEYSAIAHGNFKLVPKPLRLRQLLQEMIDIWQARAADNSLSLTLTGLADSDLQVTTDESSLRRVLGILLDNAVDFTSAGSIRIELVAAPSEVLIAVRDSGIGMADETLARLFTPFEQGDGSSTREHGGMGLSLAIAHRLVQLLGSTLQVTSKAGEGSSFFFSLPRT